MRREKRKKKEVKIKKIEQNIVTQMLKVVTTAGIVSTVLTNGGMHTKERPENKYEVKK